MPPHYVCLGQNREIRRGGNTSSVEREHLGQNVERPQSILEDELIEGVCCSIGSDRRDRILQFDKRDVGTRSPPRPSRAIAARRLGDGSAVAVTT
jgi:hypothetical protein